MTVNTDYDVRSGALASEKTPGLTFIDRRIPKKFWPYLVTHEQVEKRKMAEYTKAGMSKEKAYLKAHTEDATPAERAHLEKDGGDWKKYTHEMDGYLATIEHEKVKNEPPAGQVDPELAVDAGHHHSSNKLHHKEISTALIELASGRQWHWRWGDKPWDWWWKSLNEQRGDYILDNGGGKGHITGIGESHARHVKPIGRYAAQTGARSLAQCLARG